MGHLGNDVQAAIALKHLKDAKPEFSISCAREHLFYLKRDDQIKLYLEGLKKAGLA